MGVMSVNQSVPRDGTVLQEGTVYRVNISDGGAPKHSVEDARVNAEGLVGDRQRSKGHGGPERAVLLLGLDLIETLQAEGHPIASGTTGENLTLAGVDWSAVAIGSRFVFEDGLELEALSYAPPCAHIGASFRDGDFKQLDVRVHPTRGRICTRVVRQGSIRVGESFRVETNELKTG